MSSVNAWSCVSFEDPSAAQPAGPIDAPFDRGLTATGRTQAAAARNFLSSLDVGGLVTSDSPRALETAEIIADGRGVRIDVRLAGLNLGAWASRPLAELPQLAEVLSDPNARSRGSADHRRQPGPRGCGRRARRNQPGDHRAPDRNAAGCRLAAAPGLGLRGRGRLRRRATVAGNRQLDAVGTGGVPPITRQQRAHTGWVGPLGALRDAGRVRGALFAGQYLHPKPPSSRRPR